MKKFILVSLFSFFGPILYANAAIPNVDFTVNMSEAVNVSGCPANCPRIAIDVGGETRYAEYIAGTGTSALTFSYSPVVGDVDLNGVALTSPIDLNGGVITDLNGNSILDLTFGLPNTAGIVVDYPSLSMDFTDGGGGRYTLNGESYNTLSTFLSAAGGTFTRNSEATYFDSNGILQVSPPNQPRFDYDPVTFSAKGILIEEGRTNEAYHSTNPQLWINNGVTITPTGVIEMGVFNSIRISSNGQTFHRMNTRRAPSGLNSPITAPVTVTFYYRAGTSGRFTVHMYVTDGSATSSLWGSVCAPAPNKNESAGSIEVIDHSYIGGVCRLQFRFSPNNTVVGTTIGIGPYSNVVGEDVIVLGAQVEYGDFPTSFIPTAGASVARVSDALSIPVSSWFNSDEGTLYARSTHGRDVTVAGIAALQLDASNRISIIRTSVNGIETQIRDSSGVQQQNTINGGGHYSTNQSALSYKQNNSRSSINGTLTPLDTLCNIPTVSILAVGRWAAYYNGHIEAVKYYPSRMPDSQLQILTQ